MKTFSSILAWILTIVLAIGFLLAGGVKLVGTAAMVQEFAHIGAGQWFRYVTGILEISGAVGLFLPKYRFWAALLIAAIMASATAINLLLLHAPAPARITALLLALALLLASLRRPHPAPLPAASH